MRLVSSIPNIIKGDWNSAVNFAIAVQKNINKLSGSKLGSDSSPSFSSLTLTGLTSSRLISTDTTKTIVSTDLNSWVTGTANQVNVANDGDGTITLSTPQDIHTGATPQFAGMTLTGLSGILKATAGIISGSATLDDVAEGINYGRVAANELSSGIYVDATTTTKGIASFNNSNFSVTGGAVSLMSLLSDISALNPTDGNIIVGNGTTWVAESGATARTSLGLGADDSPTFAGLTITRTSTAEGAAGITNLFVSQPPESHLTNAYGLYSRIQITGANNIAAAYGTQNITLHSGTGTVTNARGNSGAIWCTGGGTIITGSALFVAGPSVSGVGSAINTINGLYITAQKITGVTTAYGINQVGVNDINNFVGKSKFGTAGVPAEDVHASDTVRADIAFNLNGTDGVTQAASAGTVCDVTALAGGIATAQTQITYATNGVYNFDATSGKVSSITITNGRITAITTAA